MNDQTASDSSAVDQALANFRETMEKDDYHLKWSLNEEEKVTVEIEAGPEACADCLSPTPVMEAIMGEALSSTPYTLDRVVLPNEH
ncbi:hypothetical protein [Nesterenkonia haasae]|uniref:hypothetical protein n=1 Tax=Nesterenkonia haasae TaxID=2587813 RepID=UPI001391D686|nr:hypothetical protein [Nesterenkonia haasae]NDK30227.1 hypothetical protein [Nesterenkonia haasae]